MVEWSEMNFGGLKIKTPIVQGGMGVKISERNLVAAVANEGGIGVLASVGLGDHRNFKGTYAEANAVALISEIEETRKMTNGVIGVNIMHALSDYEPLVSAAINGGIDIIFSGAGIPRNLPILLQRENKARLERGQEERDVKLAFIASSARYAGMMIKSWEKAGHRPDAIVVEGPLAGGHLGFNYDDLANGTCEPLEDIVSSVLDVVGDKGIPVIAAGGIYTGADIYKFLELGAAGVQLATRFVVTYECDAADEFKQVYINARKEDIRFTKSPVGLPGRIIKTDFIEAVMKGEGPKFGCPYKCLKSCARDEAEYCIADALVNAYKGKIDESLVFAGANAYRCDEIVSVKVLMDTLKTEYSEAADK